MIPVSAPLARAAQSAATRYAEANSIGQASRALKQRHFLGRIWRAMLGVAVVVLTAMMMSSLLGGIGPPGLVLTALCALLSAALLLGHPRLKVPNRDQLAEGPLSVVIGQTELWLESRAASLPPAAARLVDHVGIQLDALGLALDRMGEPAQAVSEIRRLLGERLPRLITAHDIGRAGDGALVAGLERAVADLAYITRHIAGGRLDDLVLKAWRLDA